MEMLDFQPIFNMDQQPLRSFRSSRLERSRIQTVHFKNLLSYHDFCIKHSGLFVWSVLKTSEVWLQDRTSPSMKSQQPSLHLFFHQLIPSVFFCFFAVCQFLGNVGVFGLRALKLPLSVQMLHH